MRSGPQVAADHAEADARQLIADLKAKRKAFKARLGEVTHAGDIQVTTRAFARRRLATSYSL
jgi:hypothetical protein